MSFNKIYRLVFEKIVFFIKCQSQLNGEEQIKLILYASYIICFYWPLCCINSWSLFQLFCDALVYYWWRKIPDTQLSIWDQSSIWVEPSTLFSLLRDFPTVEPTLRRTKVHSDLLAIHRGPLSSASAQLSGAFMYLEEQCTQTHNHITKSLDPSPYGFNSQTWQGFIHTQLRFLSYSPSIRSWASLNLWKLLSTLLSFL